MTIPQALGMALILGAVLGGGVRLAMGRRTHLGLAASVLSGIVGAFIGTALMTAARGSPSDTHIMLGAAAAILGTVVVLVVATALTRKPEPTAEQLIVGGESMRVEFKSSARFNKHTKKRDEKLELVIAKTIAALANSDGGYLVVGVADDGQVLGLDDDYPLMKQPDSDRFELWLRDYLTQTIGAAATTSLDVQFPTVSGSQICVVRVPDCRRPVYVTPNKSDGPQLWVRVGNSTRQLPLDQALAYASDRWGRRGLRARGS